ncbi:tripartite tricarboxylate transporter permease [Roseibaca sp. V10]|uniref:Tripartite tricarboxylate transporter permease n=1 Tax=Roseinatronobacter domitianus TaxID=2940293 RepID=A0ABT0M4H9_9RHOB|nr:tripartite tricarboxylate transporter permease [Roseibaca domitiana]MCL1629760.1 tripartite tricarboxylate transporter permease [Roseibaca domitiana]
MEVLIAAALAVLQPHMLLIVLLGVTAGLFVGALPGLTATMALALMLPFTFAMEALEGLVALGAVYMGTIYGGAFTAILINTPGTPSSIATTFDGHPMAKQGRALEAISIATIASVVGGVVGVVFLLLAAPPLAQLALKFGPSEMFWVAILGLTLIGSLATGSVLKGLLGGAIGLIIGTIGISPIGGESRFTFGWPPLQAGVSLIVALIGLFVIPELLSMMRQGRAAIDSAAGLGDGGFRFGSAMTTVFSKPVNLIRSCVIGQIIAIIPGAGGSITSLVAYNEAKRGSDDPDSFGKGNPEGLVASESSNNVMVAGSMVPLLTLGIPGAPPDAVILGVMLLHGLRPGLELFSETGVLANGFIISMGLAALMLIPVGLLGGRLIYQVIRRTPHYFLVPTILVITILGTYALRNNLVDVALMLGLGIVGFAIRGLGLDAAPIVLGLILGTIAEQGYVQTILGGMAMDIPQLRLLENTLSQILIVLTVAVIGWTAWPRKRRQKD